MLPSQIGLSNLRVISFSNVRLSGTIPTEISLLEEVEDVRLSFSDLEGTLPVINMSSSGSGAIDLEGSSGLMGDWPKEMVRSPFMHRIVDLFLRPFVVKVL